MPLKICSCMPDILSRVPFYDVQGKVSSAQGALDQAVGISFSVRETAAYAAIKAQLLLAEGKEDEAERLLQAAMSLPGIKRQPSAQPK